jgi:hypothetical protein
MGGVASFLITMRSQSAVLESSHFAGFNPGPESFRGIADFLNLAPDQSAISWRYAWCIQHHA